MPISKKLLLFICLLPLPAQAGLWDYVASGVAGAAGMLASIAKRPTLVVGLAATVGIGMGLLKRYKQARALNEFFESLPIADYTGGFVSIVNKDNPSEKITMLRAIAQMSATFQNSLADVSGIVLDANRFMILQHDEAIQRIFASSTLLALKEINQKIVENKYSLEEQENVGMDCPAYQQLQTTLRLWQLQKIYDFLGIVHYMDIPVLENMLTTICAEKIVLELPALCANNDALQECIAKFPLFGSEQAIGNIVGQKILRKMELDTVASGLPLCKLYELPHSQDYPSYYRPMAMNNRYLAIEDTTKHSSKSKSVIFIWDLRKKAIVNRIEVSEYLHHIALSNNSETPLVAGYSSDTIYVWDLITGDLRYQQNGGHLSSEGAIAISDNNKYLVVTLQSVVFLWELQTGIVQRHACNVPRCGLQHAGGVVFANVFIGNNKKIMTVGRECFWLVAVTCDMATDNILWQGQPSYIGGHCMNECCMVICNHYETSYQTKSIIIRDVQTGKIRYQEKLQENCYAAAVTRDSRFIAMRNENGSIEIWGLPECFKNASFEEALLVVAYMHGHKTLKEIDCDFKAMVSDDVRQILGSVKR